jgi:hypothetical protein
MMTRTEERVALAAVDIIGRDKAKPCMRLPHAGLCKSGVTHESYCCGFRHQK